MIDPSKSQVQEPGGWCRGSHSWTCSLQWHLEFSWNPAELYVSTRKLGRKAKFKSGFRPILNCTHTFEAGTPTMHLHRSDNSNRTRGREMPWKSTVKSVIGLWQQSKHWVLQRQPDPKGEAGYLGALPLTFFTASLLFFPPISLSVLPLSGAVKA